MSFMFNPFPYNDPNAVNRIENDGSVDLGRTAVGNAEHSMPAAEMIGSATVSEHFPTPEIS